MLFKNVTIRREKIEKDYARFDAEDDARQDTIESLRKVIQDQKLTIEMLKGKYAELRIS